MVVGSRILLLFRAKAVQLVLFLGISFVGLFWQPALAVPACRHVHKTESEALQSVFREAFSSTQIYRPGQCGLNIKKLLLHFQEAGINPRNPEIVFLLHEKRKFAGGPTLASQILPAMSRSFEKAWLFHVVLKVEDARTGEPMILDLDYRSTVTPLRKYFDLMFPPEDQKDRLSQMTARIVDVPSYMKAFEDFLAVNKHGDQNQVVGSFRDLKLTLYPTLSVREWIEQVNPRAN